VARGAPGSILNVIVTYVDGGAPGHSHSAAAKAGVKSLTQSLAVEWATDAVRVNAISPGIFPHGDHSPHMRKNRPEGYEAEGVRIPMQRTGRLSELAWAASYLCSDYAGFVTGHNFIIDGGEHLNPAIRKPVFEPMRARDIFRAE